MIQKETCKKRSEDKYLRLAIWFLTINKHISNGSTWPSWFKSECWKSEKSANSHWFKKLSWFSSAIIKGYTVFRGWILRFGVTKS